jgi:predicted AAA+ superfamily ATPase
LYRKRLIGSDFRVALSQFPAILLTGPRQSGKSTFLARELPPGFSIVSLDDPVEQSSVRADPNGLLDRFAPRPVAIDEIQHVPELLPFIKVRVDRARRSYGRWVLTGSQQFALMAGVPTCSRGGRTTGWRWTSWSASAGGSRPSKSN